ncbi:hypothetical protein WA026_023213 [Henosepilachna vigintioctopunctata]|uniref:U6 snRNA phosphodiesterase n=1 Tax=Henosepilachna vigintioctopunctata TaxID=420089 RepID=A0AAW1VJH3_9CUCU
MSKTNSLQLLAEYGDDGQSSDDDVPGPRVSTKRTFKEDTFNTSASRLLVPDSIKKLKVNQAWIDVPADHQGRLRTFEHERGNWATFAYINYEGHEGIRHLIESIINSVPVVSMNEVDDFHISLTKTVILKHHWIFPFVNSLKEKIIHHKRFVAAFGDLKVYCNEEKSRTFIGLEIVNGYNRLLSLVKDFDNCLAEFQLPQFYDDPSFHMSILWCVGDMEAKLNEYMPLLNKRLHDIMEDYLNENWCVLANCIYCKSGNKMFQFPLE